MDVATLKQHDLRRRQAVPEEHRTEAREAAADWIVDHVLNNDRWPLALTEMSDESGWSRQHLKNVLDHYFEPADAEPTTTVAVSGDAGELHIDVPSDVDIESYLRGFLAGLTAQR